MIGQHKIEKKFSPIKNNYGHTSVNGWTRQLFFMAIIDNDDLFQWLVQSNGQIPRQNL